MPSEAEYYLNLGVRHFNISTDNGILSRFYANEGGALRSMIDSA